MIKVSMPSNIALIKYMGKKPDADGKSIPTNPSLSYTLDYLQTTVTLEPLTSESRWEPLDSEAPLALSKKGQDRFLAHLKFLTKSLDIPESGFLIKSGNNFPADCGIASSASSFAALTEAVCQWSEAKPPVEERAWLSSQGSGSSCRSFYKGWVLWDTDAVKTAETSFENLRHMVVLASEAVKKVSSSEAHQRVATSDLAMDRTHRAEKRLDAFNESLDRPSWSQLYQLAWAEFWDMHALFETSKPAFGYMKPSTLVILEAARQFWNSEGDGPLVTMDAGPNVHLLWRKDQNQMAIKFYTENLKGKFSCLSDLSEIGFARV